MTPDRLQSIEALFHAVRERPPEDRAALLSQAEPELRREVESLLALHSADGFLDRPAVGAITQLPGSSSLPVGTCLGPYRVEGKLGEGGMGEVFRAVDTRLGRAVAIKTTRAQFSDRLKLEARAISALNHPNICTIYDIGPNYLVMELVEGETIAALLKRGPPPLATTLFYATQMAAALVEAHGKGVVHRDLKPANIMIAKSGLKVLDFGVAKLTRDQTITASGMVVGTPAYMAPEQRDGKPADTRSDIYSFGCVLYEMLTGARITFQRRRLSSRKLEAIVSRCLDEEPARRWQTATELERELTAVGAVKPRATRGPTAIPTPAAGSSRTPASSARTGTSTVVLADFVNATGDPAFDGSARQILAMHLEDSARLSLLSEVRVSQTLGLMGRSATATLTPEVAAEIGERTGSAAVVEGSIQAVGSGFALGLRARHCRTGEVLYKAQARAHTREEVFERLAQLAKQFGRAVASLPLVEKEPSLAVEATTPLLEAWRSYRAATQATQKRGQSTESISLFMRAVELDPNFAMAHSNLGRSQSDLGETELGAQSIARAYELRHRVSDRENFYITFNYHRQVTRNLELARQTLESWTQKYPDDFLPHGFLSGFASPGLGHYDRAVEEGLKALALDPTFAIGYFNVAWVYIYLNRPAEAEALLRAAAERQIEVIQFSLARYAIAFLRNDRAAMEREATHRRATWHAQGWFEHQEALTCAYHGRLADANRLSDRAVLLARQGNLPERAALFHGARAVWNAFYGMQDEAHRSATAALTLSRSRDAEYGPALALVLLGHAAHAHELQAGLAERHPMDTSVQFNYLPTLRALEALIGGDAAQALELTLVAAPYDLAVPATAYFTGPFFGALYPLYVRGLAYSRLGRHVEAAGELQKIVDHPGLTLNDPLGPVARLELARALSASGNGAQAAAVYEHLLALWQDADRDIPNVAHARAEFAGL